MTLEKPKILFAKEMKYLLQVYYSNFILFTIKYNNINVVRLLKIVLKRDTYI